ncbi:MAG: HD domain-containing phosphohydrolase [Gemmatimonadota bacterium]
MTPPAPQIFLHGEEPDPPLPEAVAKGLSFQRVDSLAELDEQTAFAPSVLLLSSVLLPGLKGLPEHVVVLASHPEAARAAQEEGRLFMELTHLAPDGVTGAIRAALQHSATLLGQLEARIQLDRIHSQLRELNRIGMALMSERDPQQLLTLILTQARRFTSSDAGSIYLVEGSAEGPARLRFRLAQNHSLPDIPVPDFTLPLEPSSIAGFVAVGGEPLVLDDAYRLPPDAPYSFNRGFDQEFGYRACSMLVVPMKDHLDRVVGVLQLINRKRDPEAVIRGEADAEAHVLPFGQAELEAVQSLAGQAAVSIENGQLYQSIERLFEGFIKAAVTAIDQRDPTTSGHSVRVATLTCDLAERADAARGGPFKDVSFSREQMKELRYAGLLHDFGKVGVREEVLVKSKKLPPVLLERIESRFDVIRRTLEAQHFRESARLFQRAASGERVDPTSRMGEMEAELQRSLERLDRFQQAVREANEPRILPEESAEILHEIAATHFPDFTGSQVPYITRDELQFLSIPKGSLDPDERKQIESHVTHTYRFLQEIPWTDSLSRVAEIAYGHHEKLDGTGYPLGVDAQVIPIQTRLMTASDIFDALTASDRPYKKALPPQRALDILGMEAKAGQLDAGVVDLMVESEVYQRILQQDWRDF